MILSILGMYNHDPTIFDDFNVPDGLAKETVLDNILLNCAELEVIYSKPDIMKLAIKTWSESNQIGWNKLYNTMTMEYNPIWNVDADITETESGVVNRDIDRNPNLVDTHAVQGFNSSAWADADKDTYTGNEKVDDDTSHEVERKTRRTGNIGVTTTQQMIAQEREIADFNMIEYITESFKKRFCVMIY